MAVAPNEHLAIGVAPESAAEAFEIYVHLTMPHRAEEMMRLHHAVVAEVIEALTGRTVLWNTDEEEGALRG